MFQSVINICHRQIKKILIILITLWIFKKLLYPIKCYTFTDSQARGYHLVGTTISV